MDSKSLCRVIASYCEKMTVAFTWKDVKEYIIKQHGVCVGVDVIRKILKWNLGYSYKRCSSRPLLLNHNLSKLKKILFSVKLWGMINRSTILVNIDEAVFSHSTKANYSWCKKGVPSNISTIIFRGSISIVSAITSNGVSITGIRKGTIDSSSFIEYIEHWLEVWRRI